jgi:hypothetical protein
MGDASNLGRKKGGSAEILRALRLISERRQIFQKRDKTFKISYFCSRQAKSPSKSAKAKVGALPFSQGRLSQGLRFGCIVIAAIASHKMGKIGPNPDLRSEFVAELFWVVS